VLPLLLRGLVGRNLSHIVANLAPFSVSRFADRQLTGFPRQVARRRFHTRMPRSRLKHPLATRGTAFPSLKVDFFSLTPPERSDRRPPRY